MTFHRNAFIPLRPGVLALCVMFLAGCLSQSEVSSSRPAGIIPTKATVAKAAHIDKPVVFTNLACRVMISYDADVGSDGPLPFEAVTTQTLATAGIPVVCNAAMADAIIVVTGRVDSLSGLYGPPYQAGSDPIPQMKYITGSRVQVAIHLIHNGRLVRSTPFSAEKSPPSSIQISGSVIGTIPWGPSYSSTFSEAFPPAFSNFVWMLRNERTHAGRAP